MRKRVSLQARLAVAMQMDGNSIGRTVAERDTAEVGRSRHHQKLMPAETGAVGKLESDQCIRAERQGLVGG